MAQRGADASERSPGIRRSPVYKKDKKVVATVADPTMYTRTDSSNQQEMRRADAADAAKVARDGVIKVPAMTNTVVSDAVNTALNKPNAFTNAFGGSGGGASGAGGAGGANWQSMYNTAQKNLNAGFDDATSLTNQGYAALQSYLQQNANNPYAGFTQQVQPVANPMEQFLSSYGVSNDPVQAQVKAEQFAGEQGAGAFNSLVDILSRSAQGSNASRLAEMQMGQTMAGSNLGADRANYQAQNALELLKKRLAQK